MVMAKDYVALGSRYCRKTESLVGSSFMVTSGSILATVNPIYGLSTKGEKGRSKNQLANVEQWFDVKQASKGARPGQLETSTDIDIPRTGYCASGYGSKDQKPRWKEMARAGGAGGLARLLACSQQLPREPARVAKVSEARAPSVKHRRVFPWPDD
jgi:hypothetical protein